MFILRGEKQRKVWFEKTRQIYLFMQFTQSSQNYLCANGPREIGLFLPFVPPSLFERET